MQRLVIALVLLASQAAAQTPAQPRFRAAAEVIAIDVTVTGPDGTPVANLQASDFDIRVEGQPRAIQSAQFLRSESADRIATPDVSSNTDPASGRLLLIVTDDSSLRAASQPVVSAARALLNHLAPGDLVGVAHIPEGGGVPFTTDRARVLAELQRVRPASASRFRGDATIYISEALDYDGSQRMQWPAAVKRECGEFADTPSYRLCILNLTHAASQMVLEETARTAETIRGLERLMKTLEPTGQPATIVLISERLVVARDPAALAGLAAACASARVTLHVVQPAPNASDLGERGTSFDPDGDRIFNAEGLERMAAQARGEFYRAVGNGAPIFERIGREVSGYYLLGIEPTAEDRKHPRRRVDVRVRKPGVTVRARSMFALNGRTLAPATDNAGRLRQLLEAPSLNKSLPISVTSRTINGESGNVRVLVAAEIGDATDQDGRFDVGLIAIDRDGAVKSRAAANTSLSPARESRQSPSLFTTSLLLSPGDYTIRVAAIDAAGREGSVHHVIRAAMREWPGGWRTSDLVVANQPNGTEYPPFNASAIVDSSRVAAIVDVAHRDSAAMNAATVEFQVNDEESVAGEAPPRGANGSRSFAALLHPAKRGIHTLRARVTVPGEQPVVLERSFAFEPPLADPLDPGVMRGYIEMLEQRHPISPSLEAFVTRAKAGQFGAPPEAESRPDGDIAMVTFIGALAALRDNKPALARALLQQTLRTSPGFEGASFYLTLIP